MSERNVTQEARRALFRAQVVTIASGEPEVTPRRIAAAMLSTPQVRSVCARVGISVIVLDSESQQSYARVLTSVEESLAAHGEPFGSASHIASLRPRPMNPGTQRVLASIAAISAEQNKALNPVDVLVAVLLSDSALRKHVATQGLTVDMLRENNT